MGIDTEVDKAIKGILRTELHEADIDRLHEAMIRARGVILHLIKDSMSGILKSSAEAAIESTERVWQISEETLVRLRSVAGHGGITIQSLLDGTNVFYPSHETGTQLEILIDLVIEHCTFIYLETKKKVVDILLMTATHNNEQRGKSQIVSRHIPENTIDEKTLEVGDFLAYIIHEHYKEKVMENMLAKQKKLAP